MRAVTYKQGIQCWVQTLAGGAFHKCATSKTDTRHTEFSKVSCNNATQHCKVPCVKVPTTAIHQRHTRSQDRGAFRQGAAIRHTVQHCALSTRTAVPIRQNVSSSLKTTRRQSQTWSNLRNTILRSMDTTQSMFQLVFQVQKAITYRFTDSRHKTDMHRCHSQHCNESTMADGPYAPNTRHRTGSNVPLECSSLSVRLIPSLPHKNNPVAQTTQPTRAVTIPRANNWLQI